jgi:3-methyladenine DNA glycosylase AlkD
MAGRVPRIRAQARAIAREHKHAPATLVDKGIELALTGNDPLGFECFRAAPKAVALMSPAQIQRLLPVLSGWCSTDCFGSFISGVAWRQGVLTDQHILAWTRSEHLWTRRAALVSTVPLNQPARGATAPRGEARRTLAVCERLIDDREDMIVKGLSWALRVLAVKDPEAVVAFVDKHRERLAARVIRETNNKLRTGLKNPKKAKAAKPLKRPPTRAKSARKP